MCKHCLGRQSKAICSAPLQCWTVELVICRLVPSSIDPHWSILCERPICVPVIPLFWEHESFSRSVMRDSGGMGGGGRWKPLRLRGLDWKSSISVHCIPSYASAIPFDAGALGWSSFGQLMWLAGHPVMNRRGAGQGQSWSWLPNGLHGRRDTCSLWHIGQ